MGEAIDLVDWKGKKTGQSTKETAHKKGLVHKVVHMIVLNPEGQLFLQKRSKQMLLAPNKWDSSSAGHVKKGEALEKAAKREMSEELGIRPKRIELLGKIIWKDRKKNYWNNELITVYRTEWKGKIKRNSESSAGKWVELKEAKRVARTKSATKILGIIMKRFF